MKSVLHGLANFQQDLEAIQDTLASKPDSNLVSDLQDLKSLFSSLRGQWQSANLPNNHPIKQELDACRKELATVGTEIAAAIDRSDTHSTASSSSSTSAPSPHYIVSKNDLPTIEVPKFSGDLLDWSSFWVAFKSTIEDRSELSNNQKLHYLRQAISDPELQLLLHSPAETPNFYTEVVEELKERFDKTREIHKLLSRTLADLSSPKYTRADLRKLVDLVKRNISSLKATKQYDLDSFLSSILFSVLPSRLQTSWAQHTKKEKGVPPISKLLLFLREHAETLPAAGPTTPSQGADNTTNRRTGAKKPERRETPQRSRGAHATSPATSYKWDCALCKPDKHPLHLCPKWATLSIPQRLGHIQSKSLCSNCLAGGHITSACKSTYRCRDCGQPHHTTIHQPLTGNPVNSSTIKSSQLPDALMTTAQVLLTGPRGQEVKARALIDSGAGLSIVSSRVVKILDLPLESTRLQLSLVQGEPSKIIKHMANLSISPLQDRSMKIPCKAAVTAKVTCDLPVHLMEQVSDLPHIMGITLADPDYYLPGRIDILLGAELAPKVMARTLLRDGSPSQPIAQATHFGWVLSGPAARRDPGADFRSSVSHQTPIFHTDPESPIKDFWLSEETEPEEPCTSEVQELVQGHFSETVKYLPTEARYEVTLPKHADIINLGDSKSQAMCRFLAGENSNRRKDIQEPFSKVMKEYFNLGHAEEVPTSELTQKPQFYLPMHAVFKDSSTSTKIRIVFDGSAATSTGISLNQALLVGPTLQPTLSNILLKFRTYPVALNADISKMYREVQLAAEDKDLHRFLWRDSPQEPVRDYRMTRVTFGVSASPYLAVRTLQQTAADHGEGYPGATQQIYQNFYVDDYLGGAETPQEAVTLYQEIRSILSKGSFSLCKWRSSSTAVLQQIPPELQETQLVKEDTSPQKPTSTAKALGLRWDSRYDNMSPSISVQPHYRTTKRGLISDVSRTYDILGWIAPAVLVMKLVHQQLWKTGQGWDEQVPPEHITLHHQWRSQLHQLASKHIPRCYSDPSHSIKHRELHGFADASKGAYGAVLYCRTTYTDRPPTVSLVTAKTKVAKLDPPTIPRLELCGAKLLTTIIRNAAAILNIPIGDWHCWSDSAIVLAWLDGRDRSHPVFVRNRVQFILGITQPSSWLHVPTRDNPADCASRGIMPQELLQHHLWWEGPPWLKEDPVPTPRQPPRKELVEDHVPVNATLPHWDLAEHICNKSSNYPSVVSTVAWWLRFCHNLMNTQKLAPTEASKPHPTILSGTERRLAEIWLLKQAQSRLFASEKVAILKGRPLSRSSKLKALHPHLDKDHLLRVGGRLANSSLTQSQQHPIIADAREPFVKMYFQHLHVMLCHCGPSLLLCHAGAKWHVLGARRLSRAVCSKCVSCRRRQPHLQHQLMGDLPAPRVNHTAPFQHTGMDFAGPFTIRQGHTRRPVRIEAYVCIFVCMTFKAVHLEVVSDQTTAAFKAALQRFVARRNCPVHLYSDNGSNFVGARNELTKLYRFLNQQIADDDIQQYISSHHRITWHNSPPRSPHFGGLWESAVKSMKRHLKVVMGNTLLTFEEMTTIVCQVEACLNSRPLLPLTSHCQDGLATLTASHFLLFRTPSSYPEDPRIPDRPDLLKKWNHCQAMVHHFWTRWSKEYLNTLQARTKWQAEQPNLQPEDIVILRPEKSLFSSHWPLGRIIKVFPGKDNLIRVVLVKTAAGTYKRAVTRLSLLFRPTQTDQPPQETSQPLPPGNVSRQH